MAEWLRRGLQILNNFTIISLYISLFNKSQLGIEIIIFQEPYFCEICKKVVNECNHQKEKKISISGTKIRNLIFSGKKIPDELMRKQISKTLSKSSII